MKPPTEDSRGQPGTRASGDLVRCLRADAGVAFLCVGTQSPPGWDRFLGRLRFQGNYWTRTEVPVARPVSSDSAAGQMRLWPAFRGESR